MNAPRNSRLTRQDLHSMMTAYKTTSLLRTGIELGVFDVLAEGALRPTEVAERLGLDARAARITLDALAALGLLELEEGRLSLAAGADELLVRESPDYFGDMVHVISSDEEWEALRRLPEAVRSGGSVLDVDAETPEYRYWEDFATYAAAIAEPTAQVMADVLEPWAKERESLDVLDVACGHGIYGFTFARRHPRAQLSGLDWANVLEVTAKHARAFGVEDRTHFIAGDMFDAPLGGPYDLVTITNVLHHFSEERATELLGRAAKVLKPGGRIAIVGFTLDDGKPPKLDPAPYLFSVLMLVWTSQGEVHQRTSYERMLTATGLKLVELNTVPGLPFRVLVAQHV